MHDVREYNSVCYIDCDDYWLYGDKWLKWFPLIKLTKVKTGNRISEVVIYRTGNREVKNTIAMHIIFIQSKDQICNDKWQIGVYSPYIPKETKFTLSCSFYIPRFKLSWNLCNGCCLQPSLYTNSGRRHIPGTLSHFESIYSRVRNLSYDKLWVVLPVWFRDWDSSREEGNDVT